MIINIAKTVLKRKCGVMMQIVLTVLRGVVRRLAFPPPPPPPPMWAVAGPGSPINRITERVLLLFFSLTCALNLHPTLNPTEMQALINRQPERTYTPNPP